MSVHKDWMRGRLEWVRMFVSFRECSCSLLLDGDNGQLFKMEDVSVGLWVGQYGREKHVQYEHSQRFAQAGCVDHYLTAHYQSPRQMLCLWNKLLTTKEGKCCHGWWYCTPRLEYGNSLFSLLKKCSWLQGSTQAEEVLLAIAQERQTMWETTRAVTFWIMKITFFTWRVFCHPDWDSDVDMKFNPPSGFRAVKWSQIFHLWLLVIMFEVRFSLPQTTRLRSISWRSHSWSLHSKLMKTFATESFLRGHRQL